MRYAIFSDIHGNLAALNAVIADIEKKNIDRIICLGDTISKGCHSHECLEIVKVKCDVVLQGNNDVHYIKSLDVIACKQNEDFDYENFYFNQKQLTVGDIEYIKNLPMCCEFELSGLLCRCFHAAPYDKDKLIFEYEKIGDKLLQFAPTNSTSNNVADIAIFGHTHSASLECLFGRRLINVGSVGNPSNFAMKDEYNSDKKHLLTMAQYVILEGEDGKEPASIRQEFVSLPYDIDKELDDFVFLKEKELYAKELKEGVYRHQERMIKRLLDFNSGIDEI